MNSFRPKMRKSDIDNALDRRIFYERFQEHNGYRCWVEAGGPLEDWEIWKGGIDYVGGLS